MRNDKARTTYPDHQGQERTVSGVYAVRREWRPVHSDEPFLPSRRRGFHASEPDGGGGEDSGRRYGDLDDAQRRSGKENSGHRGAVQRPGPGEHATENRKLTGRRARGRQTYA